MPWNGAGTYALPPAYSPEVNGTTIDANRYNGLTGDVASGITAALAKNGENTATANLPMGGFKHTGVGNAAAAGQYVAWGQAVTLGTITALDVAPEVNLNSTINNNAYFGIQVGGLARWSWGKTNTAEGGVNLGANFDLRRYDGTGALLGVVFSIARNSGNTTFTNAVGINNKAPPAAVAAPAVAVDLATALTLVNDIRTRLINFGIYI